MHAILIALVVLGLVSPASAALIYDFEWTSEKGVRQFIDVGGGVLEPITIGGTLSDRTTATYVAPSGDAWGSIEWEYVGSTYHIDILPSGDGAWGSVPVHPSVSWSTGDVGPALSYTGPLAAPTSLTLGGGWGSMGEFLLFNATGTRMTVSAPEPSATALVAGVLVAVAIVRRRARGRHQNRSHHSPRAAIAAAVSWRMSRPVRTM